MLCIRIGRPLEEEAPVQARSSGRTKGEGEPKPPDGTLRRLSESGSSAPRNCGVCERSSSSTMSCSSCDSVDSCDSFATYSRSGS